MDGEVSHGDPTKREAVRTGQYSKSGQGRPRRQHHAGGSADGIRGGLEQASWWIRFPRSLGVGGCKLPPGHRKSTIMPNIGTCLLTGPSPASEANPSSVREPIPVGEKSCLWPLDANGATTLTPPPPSTSHANVPAVDHMHGWRAFGRGTDAGICSGPDSAAEQNVPRSQAIRPLPIRRSAPSSRAPPCRRLPPVPRGSA